MHSPNPEASPLGDGVLAALRGDILTLTLRPGQKLLTEPLSARYGVGQSPLREALSVLAGEGLVVRENRRGFRVSPMSLQDLDDLIITRLTVEPAMLERAIALGNPAWEQEISASLEALRPSLQKVGDGRPLDRIWEEGHRRFHFALLATGDPSALMDFCSLLYDRYDRYRVLGIPRRAYLAGVASDHDDMAKAAISRDAPQAMATLRRHIADTSATVRANIIAAGVTDRDGMVRLPASGTGLA